MTQEATLTPEIVVKLRAATREQHEQLDNGLSASLFSKDFTLSEYREIVEKFYGLFAPLERHFEQIVQEQAVDWQGVGLDFEECKRVPLLLQDLRQLGASEAEIARLPEYQGIEQVVASVPQLVGALYVLEGSTLGGQFIAHRLENSLGLSIENGVAFFRGPGPRLAKSNWRAFCEKVNTYAQQHPEAEPAMMETANAIFALFHEWFQVK